MATRRGTRTGEGLTPDELLLELPEAEPERMALARAFLGYVYREQRDWWEATSVNLIRLAVHWELQMAEQRGDLEARVRRYGGVI